jgi:putative transposase
VTLSPNVTNGEAGPKTQKLIVSDGAPTTEEQIIAILKEHEAGMKTADLCRKYRISEATFYNWKAKYGGWRSPRLSG